MATMAEKLSKNQAVSYKLHVIKLTFNCNDYMLRLRLNCVMHLVMQQCDLVQLIFPKN